MRLTKASPLWVLLLSLVFFYGCKKTEIPGYMPQAGLALTFDDNYINDWYRHLGFFDSMGVKMTFYISSYNRLNPLQKNKLHQLQQHGHEIAFHSLNHPDFVKYLQRNPMAKLEREEINKGLKLMNQDGFFPTNFAFPYGSHNEVLDNFLLRRFKSIRFLNGTRNLAKSYTTTANNSELYAIGMDLSSGKSTQDLLNMVSQAKENNNCLVMVGHHIDRKDLRMQVPLERLRLIIQTAKDLGMEFYTVSQIARK
ncbi:MAG: hypothetical protein NVS1B13_22480 [Flavisolibacter sp.]